MRPQKRTSKHKKSSSQQIDINSFFEGLDQMRAYLDRHIQDPERRRSRLVNIAQDLLRPRSASDLGRWLVRQLREALGVRACTLLLRETNWKTWHAAGESRTQPSSQALKKMQNLAVDSPKCQPLILEEDLLMPIPGIQGIIGALWLEAGYQMDPSSGVLLTALLETAGVMLEQGLGVEALLRDPITGLLSEGAFMEQARQEMRSQISLKRKPILLCLRLTGIESIREAYGLRAAENSIVQLARIAENIFPEKTLMGVRFDTIFALLLHVSQDNAEKEIMVVSKKIITALKKQAKESGSALSLSTAFYVISKLPSSMLLLLENLQSEVVNIPASGVGRMKK